MATAVQDEKQTPRSKEAGGRSESRSTRSKDVVGLKDAQGATLWQRAIVIIDERALIRDCLAKCLKIDGSRYVTLSFPSVAAWREAAPNYPPPAVIVLCSNSDASSVAECEDDFLFLSDAAMSVPVVIMSDADDVDHVVKALKRGARGYIPTTVPLEVAIRAVHLVEAGGTFVPATSLMAPNHPDNATAAHPDANKSRFTARQIEVVQAIRHGKANKQIAYELSMCESTVKVHVRNIMRKLKAHNRTEVAMLAGDLGAFDANKR